MKLTDISCKVKFKKFFGGEKEDNPEYQVCNSEIGDLNKDQVES